MTPGYYMWKSVYNWAHRSDIGFVPRPDGETRFFGEYVMLPA